MPQLEVGGAANWQGLLDASSSRPVAYANGKDLSQRLTGAFYTPEAVGRLLVRDLMQLLPDSPQKTLRIVDPFAGDGRLLRWFIETFNQTPRFAKWTLDVHAWDCSEAAVQAARESLATLRIPGKIEIACVAGDTFTATLQLGQEFDLCITNPPWEVLKPHPKELSSLSPHEQERYVSLLKERATRLDLAFRMAKPTRKFSGWGVNLARVGTELSVRLLKPRGAYAIVLPASLFGDQISSPIRHWLFEEHTPSIVRSFPAEARLFNGVDQDFVTIAGTAAQVANGPFRLVQHTGQEMSVDVLSQTEVDISSIRDSGYSISLKRTASLGSFVEALADAPTFEHLEVKSGGHFKLGRELDETRISERLADEGTVMFVKGRDITRFGPSPNSTRFVRVDVRLPKTVGDEKLVWRDVARQSSERRVIATLIPKGTCTGNSLNVAATAKPDPKRLRALLALFNSLVFEAQVRSSIATNHVSVGAVRRLRVPRDWAPKRIAPLAKLVDKMLMSPSVETQAEIDRLVFEWFDLPGPVIKHLLDAMDTFDPSYVATLRMTLPKQKAAQVHPSSEVINSHVAPPLSPLDVLVCESVPPGGNWKDIPESVPSKRLETIRESYARGEGSRSTYYGRLDPDKPAYTINTYFTRPGNGCHIHYDMVGHQHRTMSYREAARFQSFPDSFRFEGSKTSIATQIGNAVPPLLGFEIARHLPFVGSFVDLFAGAGGLGLGFKWAGWNAITANEFDPAFARTYIANVHHRMHVGDIRDAAIQQALWADVMALPVRPQFLAVLGGPPCQGFSTAGKPRTMEDPRNWLFKDYCDVLGTVKPDIFVFENVSGLLNMEGGRVFAMIRRELGKYAKRVIVWKLQADNYAIPQRRTRVVIVGDSTGLVPTEPPRVLTSLKPVDLLGSLPAPPSAREALDDLPPLKPGEDGSAKPYRVAPQSPYQKLMRGQLTPAEYINHYLTRGA